MHGSPAAIYVTRSMISAVRHAQSTSATWTTKSKKNAAEAARKNEAAQTVENIEIARKKVDDISHQLHEVKHAKKRCKPNC